MIAKASKSLFVLDESLGFVVNRAAQQLANALAQGLAPHDVTPQQWAVLNRLWEEDGLSQQELAERTFKDPPNTTRILDKLQRKGLIVRRPDASDRRVQLIYLTDQGRRLRDVLVPLAQQVLARACAGISEDERATVLRVLKRIDVNLD
jgi:DNA-binding MarR family transcriptional regulator